MRYSTKLSDGIHILAYIYLFPDKPLSSTAISESLQTNPVVVRRLMAKLKKAKILNTTVGIPKPILSRTPEEISLYEIYQAVEEGQRFFHVNSHTNTDCPAGSVIQEALTKQYDVFQTVMLEELSQHTLSEVIKDMKAIGDFSE